MEIAISNVQEKMIVTPQIKQTINAVLNKTAEVYNIEDFAEISVLLVDDEYIQRLNKEYRAKNMPTDVLSFALNEVREDEAEEPDIVDGPTEILLGDIVISLETTLRQAQEFGHSLERELAYLTIHGMLHILGYDHETEAERDEMRGEEEHVLLTLGISRE